MLDCVKSLRAFSAAIVVAAALATVPEARAISMTFGAVSGGKVQFDGSSDSFQFLPNGAGDFSFSILESSLGSSVGLLGRIEGSFTISQITSSGYVQAAAVLGVGKLMIQDANGAYLTGDVSWNSIASVGTSFLSGGLMNVQGDVNLVNISYSGTSVELQALAAAQAGSTVLGFLFKPGKSLTQLTADGAINSATFAGAISADDASLPPPTSVPDGGSTLILLGIALTGLASWFRLRTQN